MSLLRCFRRTAAVALICAAPAFAEKPPAATSTPEDAALNRAAHSALNRADELADLSIGIRVLRDGTAVLWGTATPLDVAKAEAVLKKVPGIVRVVNTCDPVSAADPLIAQVEAAFQGTPREPARPQMTAARMPVGRRTTVQKPGDEPAARLGEPTAAIEAVNYSEIQRVRWSDPRYSRLTFDIRDGRVVIVGPSTDPTAAWDLAWQIAPLVGNRDVVVARSPTGK